MRKHFQESIMFFTFQERKKRKFEKYLKETETLFILILLNYLQKIRNLYERILIVEEIQRKQGMQGSPK